MLEFLLSLRYLISSFKSNAYSFNTENLIHKSLQSSGRFSHYFFLSINSLFKSIKPQYFSITLTASFLFFNSSDFRFYSSIIRFYASFLRLAAIYLTKDFFFGIILKIDCIFIAALIF